jgi:hypothetical protein
MQKGQDMYQRVRLHELLRLDLMALQDTYHKLFNTQEQPCRFGKAMLSHKGITQPEAQLPHPTRCGGSGSDAKGGLYCPAPHAPTSLQDC